MAKKNITTKDLQIARAYTLGVTAFKNGTQRVPHHDAELNKFFIGRDIGETPKGEASSMAIMTTWLRAWDNANLANTWDKING